MSPTDTTRKVNGFDAHNRLTNRLDGGGVPSPATHSVRSPQTTRKRATRW